MRRFMVASESWNNGMANLSLAELFRMVDLFDNEADAVANLQPGESFTDATGVTITRQAD